MRLPRGLHLASATCCVRAAVSKHRQPRPVREALTDARYIFLTATAAAALHELEAKAAWFEAQDQSQDAQTKGCGPDAAAAWCGRCCSSRRASPRTSRRRRWTWRTSSSTSVCDSRALRPTAPSHSSPRTAALTSWWVLCLQTCQPPAPSPDSCPACVAGRQQVLSWHLQVQVTSVNTCMNVSTAALGHGLLQPQSDSLSNHGVALCCPAAV